MTRSPADAHVARAVDDHHHLDFLLLLQNAPEQRKRLAELSLRVGREIQLGRLHGGAWNPRRNSISISDISGSCGSFMTSIFATFLPMHY